MKPHATLALRRSDQPYRGLLLIAVITAISLGVGILTLYCLEARLADATEERLTLLAANIADKLDHALFEHYGNVRIMAATLTNKMHDAALLTHDISQMKEQHPYYQWLGVTNTEGWIIAATDPASVGTDQRNAAWLQALRHRQNIYLPDVSDSPKAGGDRTIMVSSLINGPNGEFLGTAMIRVALSELENVFGQTISAYQNQHHETNRIGWQVVDQEGRLVMDRSLLREEGTADIRQRGTPSARLSASEEPGYVGENHLRRPVPVITGYARTKGNGEFPGFHWKVLIRVDRSEILAGTHSMVWRIGLGWAVALLPLIGLLLWTTSLAQQESANAADRLSQIKGLHIANLALQQEMALPHNPSRMSNFLQLLVDTAARIVKARYGAFGLFDKTGQHLIQFITTGMDQATQEAIGSPPTGKGLLGAFVQEPDTLRLKDLTRHKTFSGFPAHHPPMHSFLGTSVRIEGRTFGKLYLTECYGSGEFTKTDEEVIATLAAYAKVAIENYHFLSQIRDSESQYRTTMEALPLAIVRLDRDNRIRFANRTFYKDSQLKTTEAIGQPISAVLPIEELPSLLRTVHIRGTLGPQGHECLSPWLGMTHCRLFADTVAETEETLLVIKDISEQKQADQERTKLLQDRLSILDSAGEGIFGLDTEGRCTFINKSGAALLGFRPEDVAGQNMHKLIHHTQQDGSPYPQSDCPIVQAQRNGLSYFFDSTLLWRQDGASFPAQYSTHPIMEDGRILGAVVTFSDITDRKRAEDALRKSAASLRQAQRVALIGNWRFDIHDDALACSDEMCRIFDIPLGTLLTKERFLESVHTDDRARVYQARTNALHKTPYDIQYRIVTRIGTRWIREKSELEFDEQSHALASIGIVQDITEQKQAESALKVSEEHLRQAQKMEAVGLLAGGIAHDFNNLLMVMIGHSNTLLRRLSQSSPLRRYPLEIKQASDRAARLTHQLLAFSRQQALELHVVDLNDVVASLNDMLHRLIGEHIELATRLSSSPTHVKADQGQIEQVIMNLAINARDAMPNGGTLTVTTDSVDVAETLIDALDHIAPGSYVTLTVSDTGHGMDAETQAHIFEPFFTTKEKGKGTGLGLASTYGIVKQSGGSIRITSAPGRGATFTIYFPQISDSAGAGSEAAPIEMPAGGSETVLLVEDEAMVRMLVREALQEAGYRILEAANGADALSLAAEYAKPIHLLLTDVVMPRLSGRELASQLTRTHPGMKVLYLTGYTDDIALRQAKLPDGATLLNKPLLPEVLLHKVRNLLDAQHPE